MGKVLAAAGSESFVVEKSIVGSGARAEPLQAAAQSVATGISTVLLWRPDAIRQVVQHVQFSIACSKLAARVNWRIHKAVR